MDRHLVSGLAEALAGNPGHRSTVMAPFSWLVGLLVAGTVAASAASAPEWLIKCGAGASGFVVFAWVVSYGYFAWKDRDALRAERWTS